MKLLRVSRSKHWTAGTLVLCRLHQPVSLSISLKKEIARNVIILQFFALKYSISFIIWHDIIWHRSPKKYWMSLTSVVLFRRDLCVYILYKHGQCDFLNDLTIQLRRNVHRSVVRMDAKQALNDEKNHFGLFWQSLEGSKFPNAIHEFMKGVSKTINGDTHFCTSPCEILNS